IDNDVWELVPQPRNMTIRGTKYVFRNKFDENGVVSQNKASTFLDLLCSSWLQKIDFCVLSIIAAENLHLEQLDVKTAFLHGDIDEYIYMTQLESFQSAGKEQNLVCKLKKSLYRLKQAPRQWYLKFESFMQRAGLRRGRNQEGQETVVSRIQDEGFRSRV
ncbi:retrovirus-related pol polyprotein from transposon TNT 1-94, partial [Tanacetum coccineum]